MKPLTFFYLPGCPYCEKARRFIRSVLDEHPEYREVKVVEIDEIEQYELADTFDYFYVPCFFLEGENLFEGDPTREDILNAFKSAYES